MAKDISDRRLSNVINKGGGNFLQSAVHNLYTNDFARSKLLEQKQNELEKLSSNLNQHGEKDNKMNKLIKEFFKQRCIVHKSEDEVTLQESHDDEKWCGREVATIKSRLKELHKLTGEVDEQITQLQYNISNV